MRYTFCIDLDGTLKTDPDFLCYGYDNVITVQTTRTYNMIPRNGIREFLRAAQAKGKVYLTTGAGTAYGEKVTAALGVREFFREIVGSDKMTTGRWPRFEGKIIWIDNDPEGLKSKIAHLPDRMSLRQMDTWIIDTFMGEPDGTMQELIEEIEKLP